MSQPMQIQMFSFPLFLFFALDSDVDAHGHEYINSKEAGFSVCLLKSEQLQQAKMIYHYNERCLQLPIDELIKYKAFGSIDERDPSPPLTL